MKSDSQLMSPHYFAVQNRIPNVSGSDPGAAS